VRELQGSSRKWVSKYPLNENRSPIFPERFLIGIAIAITIRKSLIDFQMRELPAVPSGRLAGEDCARIFDLGTMRS
jgi:hypothetical protein